MIDASIAKRSQPEALLSRLGRFSSFVLRERKNESRKREGEREKARVREREREGKRGIIALAIRSITRPGAFQQDSSAEACSGYCCYYDSSHPVVQ